jgi:hypothetical protein
MNRKTIGSPPIAAADAKTVQRTRYKYGPYCFNRCQFLAAVCSHNHFFAVDVAFDITTKTFFDHVTAYDPLRLQSQKGKNIENTIIAGQFLLQIRLFLFQYCFCDKDYNNKLHDDSSFILQRALSAECPQQKNPDDCSLFASATLLHLAHGLPITQAVFTQQHITQCRLGLAAELSTVPGSSLRLEYGEFTKTPVINAHFLKLPHCAKNTRGIIIFNGGQQQNTQFRSGYLKTPISKVGIKNHQFQKGGLQKPPLEQISHSFLG